MPNETTRPKGSRQLRKGRYSGENQIYHVIACTFRGCLTFTSLAVGRAVVLSLKREDEAGHTETLAFVVMPNHLHWLFQLRGSRALSTCVNTAKSHAARRINAIRQTSGRIWQKGFYDRAIRREEDLPAVARYIVANPLRSAIVKSVRMYPHWDAKWV